MTHPFWHGRKSDNPHFPKGLKAELARELQSEPSYLSAVFKRSRTPSPKFALRLQKALADRGYETTLEDFYTKTNHPLFG